MPMHQCDRSEPQVSRRSTRCPQQPPQATDDQRPRYCGAHYYRQEQTVTTKAITIDTKIDNAVERFVAQVSAQKFTSVEAYRDDVLDLLDNTFTFVGNMPRVRTAIFLEELDALIEATAEPARVHDIAAAFSSVLNGDDDVCEGCGEVHEA
jgi:hypothetical protein